ncbi:amidase [Bimuria novae-zelandiae CBS 107.79]|uniref:amidase n=1 Tax=Bimuria novae-zelandiae CBS 107.79 TaxID=1447943 RepID=A0A6A5V7C8_9PLEO|nr:amidase [Bimuria novae-zelandiae CBS 107.79]
MYLFHKYLLHKYLLLKYLFHKPREPWQAIAKRAQDHRDATLAAVQPPVPDILELPLDSTLIPKTLLTQEELQITESDPMTLIQKMSSGVLSSEAVTNAFLRRAAVAQKLVNCVTELMPEAALWRTVSLDAYLKEHGKPLPISTKEMIHIAGLTCNAAFIVWHDRVPDKNAHILEILLDAGCVLYARTTQPQTLMYLETSSNYYRITVNPFNRNLTSGGSSGGKGALLGLRGSSLGIGTDIGGSIRVPAANNGVYGLRPTSKCLPNQGMTAPMPGAEHILGVIGPLSTSLPAIPLFVKTLLDAKPWLRDPSLVPLPWNTSPRFPVAAAGSKTIKIGVMYHDGVVQPHTPIYRVLQNLHTKLADVPGIEVTTFTPYKHDEAWDIIYSLYFADGGAEEKAALAASGAPWRPLSKFILSENLNVKPLSVPEVWDLTIKRDEYRNAYARHRAVSGIDVLICPVGPGAAPKVDCARYWGYTAQWNLLDYPALIAPVSKVLPIDILDPEFVAWNDQDAYNHSLYSPEKYANAPVSVQVVGRRFEDEKVVEAWAYVQEKLGLPWAEYV